MSAKYSSLSPLTRICQSHTTKPDTALLSASVNPVNSQHYPGSASVPTKSRVNLKSSESFSLGHEVVVTILRSPGCVPMRRSRLRIAGGVGHFLSGAQSSTLSPVSRRSHTDLPSLPCRRTTLLLVLKESA